MLALALGLLSLASPALAQSGANVLLVVNERSADGQAIADHYARERGVPAGQVLRVAVEPGDEIDRAAFEQQVQAPIDQWLAANFAHDRILFLVLTKGMPLKIRGTPGRSGTQASVESELALAYRRLAGTAVPLLGPVANPYFRGDAPVAGAARFTHEAFDVFLVTRLDGFTRADALALVDRGAAPTQAGQVLLDQKASLDEDPGNLWLRRAAEWLTANGFAGRVEMETTSRTLTGRKDVLGYYSWGSNDPGLTGREPGLGFAPGSLAAMYVSTDGRTFEEPPADWKPGPWTDRRRFFAGSPESLAGDLVRAGATGVAAHVAEPFLDGSVRPDILFPAYVSGFTLAEAFSLATPSLSWQTLVVGDPLCAPFRKTTMAADEIDPGLDGATGLPRYFAARRLEALVKQGAPRDAAVALLRSEARTARGDRDGARAALEEAARLAPRFRPAQLLLATMNEQAGEYDAAIARYRQLLELDPRDWAAGNNLAYALAVRKRQPEEALRYAERAYALAPNSPQVADTLGWVRHLLGQDAEAGQLLARAVSLDPGNAEVRLHAAVVYAAAGLLEAARKELEEALRLDPGLAEREEAKGVREGIKKAS